MNNIKSFEDFVNEGLFDFLKSDVIDFTKEEKPKKKRGFLSRLIDVEPEETDPNEFPKSEYRKYMNAVNHGKKWKGEEQFPFRKKMAEEREKAEAEAKLKKQRPYYGVQEEEEEEVPYKKVVRRSDDYWSDENVRKREARKRKTTSDRGPK